MGFMKRLFVKYPITRGMATYGVLWPASNIIQQFFITKEKEMDWAQTTRFGLYGALLSAPASYGWMTLLGKLVPRVIGSSTIGSSIIKVAFDQAIYAPFAITSFYFWLTFFEKKDLEEAIKEVKNKFLPTYQICLCIWPMVLFVGFNFIPLKNRVVFIGVISFFWNVFLSYMKSLSPSDADQIENELESYESPALTAIKKAGEHLGLKVITRKDAAEAEAKAQEDPSSSTQDPEDNDKITIRTFDSSKSTTHKESPSTHKESPQKIVDLKVEVDATSSYYPTRINEEYVTQTLSLRHIPKDRNNNKINK